jgi:O-antigen ligase
MAAVYVKNFNEHNRNSLLSAPQFKWVFLITFCFVITLTHAVLPYDNREATVNLIKLVVIISIAYKIIDTDQKLDYTLWAFISGAAYIGFLAFQVGRDETGRVESVGTVDAPDANGIAAAIVPSLVLCLYYFWVTKSKLQKFLIALAGAFIANAIVLINSRASFLAAVVSIGYFLMFLLFSRYQRQYQRISAVGLILFGLAGTAYVVDEVAIQRFLSITEQDTSGEEQSGATRVFFWGAAYEMSKDHPFGKGANSFEYFAPEYLPDYIDTGYSRNRAVHSTWFEALTDTGYPGLFFLIMMILSCFNATRRCKQVLSKDNEIDRYYKIVAIEAAFVAFVVAMSFMNRFRAEILYWCVLFTACAYNIYVLRRTVEEKIEEKSFFQQLAQ